MRRAAGDVAGKTVAAQVRQAARHLGYAPDDWRPRELWYGRCASAAALDDLRQRFAAWRKADVQATSLNASDHQPAFEQRVAAIRRHLAEVKRQIEQLDGQVSRLLLDSDGGEDD